MAEQALETILQDLGVQVDKPKSNAKASKDKKTLLAALAALGGQTIQDDALEYSGDKFILPKQYESRPISAVIEFLEAYDAEQNNRFEINRKFNFHPYDVANAFQRTLKRLFGTTGFGKAQYSLFGRTPPQYATVNTSATETIQVPWGKVELPVLEAQFMVGYTGSKYGVVGYIAAELPKRYRGQVEGLFRAIEDDLKSSSIYRGKAIDAAWMEAEFLDLSSVNGERIVYAAETEAQINANVWSVMEHAKAIKAHGMPLKRAVLLEGPYGTGKSLTGYLTAQKAVANGWTFIYCRPGQDLKLAFHAAKLYAPSVVFFEDLDVIADSGDLSESDRVSELLDMFDGVSNKSTPIVAVLTTNHVERLHRGMLRPGRLDAVIHIGELDAGAIEKLVRATIPEGRLAANVDFEKVYGAMVGFLPAFIVEAAQRAVRYTIARGDNESAITTEDLVNSAEGLRPQLELMTGANEAKEPDTLSEVFETRIREALDGSKMYDNYNDNFGRLQTVEAA